MIQLAMIKAPLLTLSDRLIKTTEYLSLTFLKLFDILKYNKKCELNDF